jgi:hypothetical protein
MHALSGRFPERRFVLRPHPGEKTGVWRDQLAELRNVSMERGGSAAAWALAADLLIHNSCTTGLEAGLLGRPTLSFCPINNFNNAVLIVNNVGPVVSSIAEVTAVVDDLGAAQTRLREQVDARVDHLERHLACTRDGSSADAIVEAIRAALAKRPATQAAADDPRLPGFDSRSDRHALYATRVRIDPESVRAKLESFLTEIGGRGSISIDDLGGCLLYVTAFSTR